LSETKSDGRLLHHFRFQIRKNSIFDGIPANRIFGKLLLARGALRVSFSKGTVERMDQLVHWHFENETGGIIISLRKKTEFEVDRQIIIVKSVSFHQIIRNYHHGKVGLSLNFDTNPRRSW
jgi:hypothetical protein